MDSAAYKYFILAVRHHWKLRYIGRTVAALIAVVLVQIVITRVLDSSSVVWSSWGTWILKAAHSAYLTNLLAYTADLHVAGWTVQQAWSITWYVA
ncbi:MAG: hypothetical protein HY320_07080, partial [Armatimonadetes bacterium]|nr:hypothetical protein [Armatimonadota bacterium]